MGPSVPDEQPIVGTNACEAHHVGYELSGILHIRTDDGKEFDIGPEDAYEILSCHDVWVVSDEVALEFQRATVESYGQR